MVVMPLRSARRRAWAAGLASASILATGLIGWKLSELGEAAAQSPPLAALPAACAIPPTVADPVPAASDFAVQAPGPELSAAVASASPPPSASSELPVRKPVIAVSRPASNKEPRNVFDSRR